MFHEEKSDLNQKITAIKISWINETQNIVIVTKYLYNIGPSFKAWLYGRSLCMSVGGRPDDDYEALRPILSEMNFENSLFSFKNYNLTYRSGCTIGTESKWESAIVLFLGKIRSKNIMYVKFVSCGNGLVLCFKRTWLAASAAHTRTPRTSRLISYNPNWSPSP